MAEQDALTMDIIDDLENIDNVFTTIINNPVQWQEFIKNPNGVLIQLGLHPPTSDEISDRMNRIFYAALTNTELVDYIVDFYKDFRPDRLEEYQDYHKEGLKQGKLQNKIDLDLEAVAFIHNNEEVMRTSYMMMLVDINNKGLLQRKYNQEELETYTDGLVQAVRQRRPMKEFPALEKWDRNYGLGGSRYGTGSAEIAVWVTAAVPVQGIVVATVIIPVAVIGLYSDSSETMLTSSSVNDLRAQLTIQRVLNFASELMLHAYKFEK